MDTTARRECYQAIGLLRVKRLILRAQLEQIDQKIATLESDGAIGQAPPVATQANGVSKPHAA